MSKHKDSVWKPILIVICIIAITIALAGCGTKSLKGQREDDAQLQDGPLDANRERTKASSSEMNQSATPTIESGTPTTKPSERQQVAPSPAPAPNPAPSPVRAPAPSQKPDAPVSVKKKKPSIPVQQQQEMTQTQRKLSLAELRIKYSDIFKVQGHSNRRIVALTFDDGPDDLYTPQVLNVLKATNVKATFFLLGKRVEANPAIVSRMVREGHVIGNHSYSHPLFTKLSLSAFQKQIDQTNQILKAQIGYSPKLIRPPYGEITEEQLKWTGGQKFIIVNWNVDSLDWKGLSAEQVSNNILSTVKSGAIVLQHSAGGDTQDLSGTVSALATIIQKLKADGYEFVTVPSLLNISKQLD